MQNEENRQQAPPRFSLPKEWGVDQPEYIPHLTDQEREAKLDMLRQRKHKWKQEGREAICISDECPDTHGFLLPMNKLLVGTDNAGMPIFRDLTLSE
jgi:hypothetical protein